MEWEASGNEKKPKKVGKGKVILIVLVALILVGALGGKACSDSKKNEPLDWPTTGLAAMLPDPPSKYGEVDMDSTSLDATFEQTDSDDYNNYVEACKEKGFTVDAEEGSSYKAYNEEGYKLYVYSSGDHMSVDLDEPVEMGEISWPTSGIAAMLPAPASGYGVISSDSSDYFHATMGKTDAKAYAAYVEKCIAAGFDVDYNKQTKYFSAEDAKGNDLSIKYLGFSMMDITLNAADEDEKAAEEEKPAKEETKTEQKTEKAETKKSESKTASSSDARAAIDEYEKFVDEYVAFMKKYKESNNSVSMLADYGKMMGRLAEMEMKFDALDGTLSDADAAYYLEVQGRVLQKLAEVQ